MIRVFLVDDRCLILEAVRAILEDAPEIEIVGMAQNCKSAIAQATKLQPDIILIDLEMPNMDGIAATKHISQHLPNIKVIILTGHKAQSYVNKALLAGASGYLTKDSLVRDLRQAIYSLNRGYTYIETKLLNQAVERIQGSNLVRKKIRQTKYIKLKKYQKNVYSPRVTISAFASKTSANKKFKLLVKPSNSGESINKVRLTPTFSLSKLNEVQRAEYSTLTTAYRVKQKHIYDRQFEKRIILISIAIASLILAIIIF